MKPQNIYSDPCGKVYVDAFADEEEEAAWVEQEKRIMERNIAAAEDKLLAA